MTTLSYVGSTSANADSGSTTVATAAFALTAGNHVAVYMRWENSNTTATVTDTAGNTYLPMTQTFFGVVAGRWYYCLNALGHASNVVTLTLAAAKTFKYINAVVLSGSVTGVAEAIATSNVANSIISAPAVSANAGSMVLLGESSFQSDATKTWSQSSSSNPLTITPVGTSYLYAAVVTAPVGTDTVSRVVTYTGSNNGATSRILAALVFNGPAAVVSPVNDRDVRLQATSPRYAVTNSKMLLVSSSTPTFKVVAGASTPTSATLTAQMVGLATVATWACTGGTLTGAGDNVRTLTYANMSADVATITATVVENGVSYTASYVIAKITDGAAGTGTRGAGHFYITGSSWPNGDATADAAADAATPGANVADDVVTMSNGSTFVMEKRWTGSAWVATGVVIDGSLLVTTSVTAAKINSNGLTIRDASGNIILGTGSALDWTKLTASGLSGATGILNSNVSLGTLGYTGATNASYNPGAFANLSGTITSANAASYFAANSIAGTYIYNLVASSITSGTLSSVSISINSGQFAVNTSGGVTAFNFFGHNSQFGNTANPGVQCILATGNSFSSIEMITATSGSSNSAAHGMRGKNTSFGTSALVGMAGAYDFYADGAGTNYGPFTGAHDSLLPNGADIEIGDLLIDVACVNQRGFSNTIFTVERSSEPYQRGCRGPMVGNMGPLADRAPAAFIEGYSHMTDADGRDISMPIMSGSYYALADTHQYVVMNAVGEGSVKVCNEGGEIGPDDLLVTSSIPGVAMKQNDDLVRGYTVAKARVNKGEAVTFADAAEVKVIACIYLGG